MKVTLEMLGAMKKPLGQGPVEIDVGDGTTIGEFMVEKLGYATGHIDLLAYYLDGKKAKPSAVLAPGSRLKVLMIIGGG